MTAPPTEGAAAASVIPLPDLRQLNTWQWSGLACANCAHQLLFLPRVLLATVRDTAGWPADLYLCPPCARPDDPPAVDTDPDSKENGET